MLSAYGQENLINAHQMTAANKPLNQSVRTLQPKTPGPALQNPFRPRNDENAPLHTTKADKKLQNFITPVPKPVGRAPLCAKTTNAKATTLQTPAPDQKLQNKEHTIKQSTRTRRSVKKKIHVAAESVEPAIEVGHNDEPDFGYAPPPIAPIPDSPIQFDYDTSYACLRPENFCRGVGETYFQSPVDENGFSISLRRQEETDRKTLEDNLEKAMHNNGDTRARNEDANTEAAAAITAVSNPKSLQAQEAAVSTVKARAAAAAISEQHPVRTHRRLPSAATRETASSRQKRKTVPSFFIAQEESGLAIASKPPAVSRNTIGFPKAKKPPSILPRADRSRTHPRAGGNNEDPYAHHDESTNQSHIIPRRFVELYGEPPEESDMWFQLMELEIVDRQRGDVEQSVHQQSIFEMDFQDDLDQKLAVHFDEEDGEVFQLTL